VIAVANSSPIILLGRIGQLQLLRNLFERVLIPPAVREEILVSGGTRPGAAELEAATWIGVEPQARPETAEALIPELGRGEAEVIALAFQAPPPLVLLMDDAAGRRRALESGFVVLGSAGVIVRAKERGLIPAVRPLLAELRAAGLYLSDGLYDRLLSGVGEAPT
jgi:uncharacterized protein